MAPCKGPVTALRIKRVIEFLKVPTKALIGTGTRKRGSARIIRRTWHETLWCAVQPAKHEDYELGRWEALLRYCDDGRLEIDNNAAERALRVVGLGRKNFLFAGSDGGGESAAAMYTLIGTAKLNGIDPESYL